MILVVINTINRAFVTDFEKSCKKLNKPREAIGSESPSFLLNLHLFNKSALVFPLQLIFPQYGRITGSLVRYRLLLSIQKTKKTRRHPTRRHLAIPCRIYAYVNSPETSNLNISSNGSRIGKQENFFYNPYPPILVLVLHMKKHLKDGWRAPNCVGQISYFKVP